MKKVYFKRTLLSSIIALCYLPAQASFVRNDISYQYFRDFAENKGQFFVGASNIPIYNHQGNQIGTMLPNLPMPDLKVANRDTAIATLNDPQYVSSVRHNSGYGTVSFGYDGTASHPDAHYFNYLLVDRNNHPKFDYHTPRLHKLVTEVAPIPLGNLPYDSKGNPTSKLYLDKTRFPLFVRLGSGTQYLRNPDNSNDHRVAGAYNYVTGGAPLKLTAGVDHWIHVAGSVADDIYGSMATYAAAGDSGSPLFAYDNIAQRWVMAGTISTYTSKKGSANNYITSRPDFLKQSIDEDQVILGIDKPNTVLNWQTTDTGSSTITQNNSKQVTLLDLANPMLTSQDSSRERPSLNNGKTLHLLGENSTLVLKNSINQGAGALYFYGNTTVKPETDQQWLGAGVSVDINKTVNWQVSNPKEDRLSKIGQGTLHINGIGINPGSLSVGEGKVILNQRANAKGEKQAFSEVGIVSGRPTVSLADATQVNPDNIYFGFRGGRLDLNGNALTFSHIQNIDDGARITNQNPSKTAQVTITAQPQKQIATEQDIEWLNWKQQSKSGLSLYEYKNNWQNNRKDYFVLKNNRSAYFPTNGKSDANWEYLGSDKAQAIETVLARYNQPQTLPYTAFNGYFGETDEHLTNGPLDVIYNTPEDTLNIISGGTALKGQLSVLNGKLLLTGRPVPHAKDQQTNQEVIPEDNWITREFQATQFQIHNNATLYAGRDVSHIKGNLTATDNAMVQLGFLQGKTPVCIRSDYTATVNCDLTSRLSSQILTNIPTTQIKGDIRLTDQAKLLLGKSHFLGRINADKNTLVSLSENSHWTLQKSSTVGNLQLDRSIITLNTQYETADKTTQPSHFNQLTINGNLSGIGRFDYLTQADKAKGDRIVVNGTATGIFELAVKNTGVEPNAINPLSLFHVTNPAQKASQLSVRLVNQYVDLGAYRYILKNSHNDYHLYNPILEVKSQVNPTTIKAYEDALVNVEQKNRQIETLTKTSQIKRQIMNDVAQELRTLNRDVENAVAREKQAKIEAEKFSHRYLAFIRRAKAFKELKQAELNLNIAKLAQRVAQNDLNKKTQALSDTLTQLEQTRKEAKQAIQEAERLKEFAIPFSDQKINEKAFALCQQEQYSANICEEVVGKNVPETREQFTFISGEIDALEQQLVQAKAEYAQAMDSLDQVHLTASAEEEKLQDIQQLALSVEQSQHAYTQALQAVENAENFAESDQKATLPSIEKPTKENVEEIVLQPITQPEITIETVTALDKPYSEKREVEQQLTAPETETLPTVADHTSDKEEKVAQQSTPPHEKDSDTPEANENSAQTQMIENVKPQENIKAEVIVNEQPTLVKHSDNSRNEVKTDDTNLSYPRQAEWVSQYTNTAISALSAQTNALLRIGQNLDRHLQNVSNNPNTYVWSNVEIQTTTLGSDLYRGYQQNSTLTQVGAETDVHPRIRVGTVLSHSLSHNDFDHHYNGKGALTGLTTYIKGIYSNGIFAALDMSYTHARNQLKQAQEQVNFHQNIQSFGLNVGKLWQFTHLDIQPAVAIRYHRLSGVNYSLNQANVQIDPQHLVSYSASIKLTKTIELGETKLTPAFTSYFVNTYRNSNTNSIKVNNHRFEQSFGRYFNYELSLTGSVNNWEIEAHIGQLQGNEIGKQRFAGMKIGYKW